MLITPVQHCRQQNGEKKVKTQSIDTSPDAERVLINMIRKAPITKRFAFVQSWTASMFEAGRLYEQKLHPHASKEETRLLYSERQYKKDLVDELRQALHTYDIQITTSPDYQQAIYPLAEIFEHLDIPYALSGSLASSLYGMQRATLQLDLIAAVGLQHDASLREQLLSQYYFRENEVKAAIAQETSFTIIHMKSLIKIVITLPGMLVTGQQVFHQVRQMSLIDGKQAIAVLAPEQLILQLLNAFKKSNERADDLWYDLLAVVKVQSTDLDIPFLEQQAAIIDVTQLLEHAMDDAGLTDA
jgi:hypothetical protein